MFSSHNAYFLSSQKHWRLMLLLCVITPISMAAPLSISRLGSGDGTISSDKDGIICGAACMYDFPPKTSVELTAEPDKEAHARFLNWSAGACEGQSSVCSFRTTADPQTIAAYFVGASIAAGGYHTIALESIGGTVWAWGINSVGQLGVGDKKPRSVPTKIEGLNDVYAISAGYQHTVVLKSDGTVWAWGDNTKGQLGDGTKTSRTAPEQSIGLNGIVTLSAGHEHTVALTGSGSVWAWGNNSKGQLGDGTVISREAPTEIIGLDHVIAIATGNAHTVGLKNNGTVWVWGSNNTGQLGLGTEIKSSPSPKQVPGLTNVLSIGTGAYHTVALKDDGTIWTWGDNAEGQLGDRSKVDRTKPVMISSIGNIRALSAGYNHTAVLTHDGVIWTWGSNTSGQLGDGSTDVNRSIPKKIDGVADIIAVAAGAAHTVAMKKDGTVWTWGDNSDGILGGGSTAQQSATPVQVPNLNLTRAPIEIKGRAGADGKIMPSTQLVTVGQTAKFTVTPNTGYVAKVTGCGAGTLVGAIYTTEPIVKVCEVVASFSQKVNTFALTIAKTGNGSGTMTGAGSYEVGAVVRLKATPDVGSTFVEWTPAPCANTFKMPAQKLACKATFTLKTYTVTPKAGIGGTITPSIASIVNYNSTTTFMLKPQTGYILDSVAGCEGTLAGSQYRTGPITKNCTVQAKFKLKSYTVTTIAKAGGAVSASKIVTYGSTTRITVTPDIGYLVANVKGCGGTLSGNTYTTGAITANCTVTATFTVKRYTVSVNATPAAGGTISKASESVAHGKTVSFAITPNTGYAASAKGCGGALSGTTYTTGTITADCTVNVVFTLKQYTVTVKAGTNGKITPASQLVNHGAKATLTVTPDAHYTATATGCKGALSGNTYTTSPITEDCTVEAAFTLNTYLVSAIVGANGTVTPASQTVPYGATTTFKIAPNAGYDAVVAGNCPMGQLASGTYTTGKIVGQCAVNFSFSQHVHQVTGTAGPNGKIAPAVQNATEDTVATLTVTPNLGYAASVSGCGGKLEGNTYTTGVITDDCAVNAAFALKTYVVNAVAGANGTITPATQTVNYGSVATFTVKPDANYTAAVSGCGGVLSGTQYITAAVTENCTITAIFTLKQFTVNATVENNAGGAVSPASQVVNYGGTAIFAVTPKTGYMAKASGCGGLLSENTYTTGPVKENCTVSVVFTLKNYTVTALVGAGGSAYPSSAQTIAHGSTATLTVSPNTGYAASVTSACGGNLIGNTYTTAAMTADCTITVTFTLKTYTVGAATVANGTITPTTQNVNHGAKATFAVSPNQGYAGAATGCGGTLTGNTYTTAAITADCTITPTFTLKTYTVTAPTIANGSVTPSSQVVNHGATATLTVSPNTGYTASVTSTCGGTLIGNTYTTAAITADCTITPIFTLKTYTVGAATVANGTITPTTQTVNHGAKATLAVSPNPGYAAAATGCGGTLIGNTYTTAAITADCTVTATFTQQAYVVTPTVIGLGGTISPFVPQTVTKGATTTFTITPLPGYAANVSGCGGTLSAVNSTYITGTITENCTVTASFTQQSYTVTVSAMGNGTVSGGGTYTPGSTVTLSATPNSGSTFSSWGPAPCASSFMMPTYDVNCVASFVTSSFTVTGNAGPGGTIWPASEVVSLSGAVTFTFTPSPGYEVDAISKTCDGFGITTGLTFTTPPISADCSVSVTFKVAAILPQMVSISGGYLEMGSPANEPDRAADEAQHTVYVSSFEIGKYEVTFDEYLLFAHATNRASPSDAGWGYGQHPVINISWDNAMAYAAWLSERTGQNYRLPTEAEWEYAARAGTTTPFWTGECVTGNQANFDSYPYGSCSSGGTYRAQTIEVGSFPANPWGLYDTIGNVWEWTCSAYGSYGSGIESTCAAAGTSGYRSRRGGSWRNYPTRGRSAYRDLAINTFQEDSLGFRLVKTP